MKRLILICLLVTPLLTGCSIYRTDQGLTKRNPDYLCLDGIEYIVYTRGHRGYMAPHLRGDKFDNPKVIRCSRKKGE